MVLDEHLQAVQHALQAELERAVLRPGLAWAPLFPLTMIANTFVHPSQLPGRLGPIADWNPISATVTAVRHPTA